MDFYGVFLATIVCITSLITHRSFADASLIITPSTANCTLKWYEQVNKPEKEINQSIHFNLIYYTIDQRKFFEMLT